jgi:hypothetical protein
LVWTSINFATTARLRDGETAGESNALFKSAEAAIIEATWRNCCFAVSASMPDPGSVTTSTRALAYRDETAESI